MASRERRAAQRGPQSNVYDALGLGREDVAEVVTRSAG